MNEDSIAEIIYKTSYKVYKKLGPGLLESVYETCLYSELSKTGLQVRKQVGMPVIYENIHLEAGYRIDLMVQEMVIVEIKSVEKLNDLHFAQLLTYLKLSERKLGLLINFNSALFKEGFKRVINGKI